jgi:predicted N-formylglutamate amidohydrolase
MVVTENSGGRGDFVILCDHASNTLPPDYADLGLQPPEMASHIAWDPGALAVSRYLAERLDAPLLWPDAVRIITRAPRFGFGRSIAGVSLEFKAPAGAPAGHRHVSA